MAEKAKTAKGNLDAGRHETIVTPTDDDHFQASCSCGFAGAARSTQEKAEKEAAAHVGKVADTVPEQDTGPGPGPSEQS